MARIVWNRRVSTDRLSPDVTFRTVREISRLHHAFNLLIENDDCQDGLGTKLTKNSWPLQVDSPTKFQPHGAPANASVSNIGKVQAQNNSQFSIEPACDGLLFPFADNAQSVYSEATYKSLLGLAQAATQGRGKHLWALHYGYMWPGAFAEAMHQIDPYFLKTMIGAATNAVCSILSAIFLH